MFVFTQYFWLISPISPMQCFYVKPATVLPGCPNENFPMMITSHAVYGYKSVLLCLLSN